MRRDRSVQPSCTRSTSARAAGLVRGEILQPALLPARRGDVCEPVRIDRRVGAHIDRGRRALEDVELACTRGARCGTHCTAVAPVPMIADALVGELVERRAVGIAAGVVVVPAAGVEGMALEALDAGNARQLRHMQRARCRRRGIAR